MMTSEASKSLSDEEIERLWDAHVPPPALYLTLGAPAFARAIEAWVRASDSAARAEPVASGVTDEMVSRFLCWKLPANFSPDCGITFKREYNEHAPWGPNIHEPVGTNLLDADQARAMLEHVLGGAVAPSPAPGVILAALRFYAHGYHFNRADDDAWDTVSGEPPNFWCDEAGTATIEDGSIAVMALRGVPTDWTADDGEAPGPIDGERAASAPSPEPTAEALRIQVKQADERGDEAMRRQLEIAVRDALLAQLAASGSDEQRSTESTEPDRAPSGTRKAK